jgi:hypothetical protein
MAYDNRIRNFRSKATKQGNHITFGNKKMTIPIFSIPALKTCPGSTALCRKYCYAKKAEELFPNVRSKRTRNLALTKTPAFVDAIVSELSNNPFMPYVRIHESGDFYNQAYLDKWFEVCRRMPEKTFLAFTKAFNLDYSKKPKNLKLYYSVFPDSCNVPKTGKKAITTIHYKSFTGTNPDVGKAAHCSGYCDTCLVCFIGKQNVSFPVH